MPRRPRQAMPFSRRVVEALPLPAPGEKVRYFDSRTRGLAIRVYGPSRANPAGEGRKTFVFYRKIEGRPGLLTLGEFPAMTVDQARGRAGDLNAAIARGENPFEKDRIRRQEETLGGLFEKFLELHAKIHKKSWKSDEWQFHQFLEPWRNRRLSGIARSHIQKLHARVGKDRGVYTANRLLALVSTLFSKAITWGWEGTNPARGIQKFKERSRERFLQGDEIPRFFAALAREENETVRDYFWIALLTGARKSNALAMRWDEVHLDRGTWTIPETKNGTPQTVTLPVQAVEILRCRLAGRELLFPELETLHPASWRRIRRRMGLAGMNCPDEALQRMRWDELDLSHGIWNSPAGRRILPPEAVEALRARACSREYVFPGPGESGHLADPKAGWRRLLLRADLESPRREDRLRIHDLRRSLGSWQINTGASTAMVGKALGHLDRRSTEVYARMSQDPVRESVQRAVDAILSHVTQDTPGDIVELGPRVDRKEDRR